MPDLTRRSGGTDQQPSTSRTLKKTSVVHVAKAYQATVFSRLGHMAWNGVMPRLQDNGASARAAWSPEDAAASPLFLGELRGCSSDAQCPASSRRIPHLSYSMSSVMYYCFIFSGCYLQLGARGRGYSVVEPWESLLPRPRVSRGAVHGGTLGGPSLAVASLVRPSFTCPEVNTWLSPQSRFGGPIDRPL